MRERAIRLYDHEVRAVLAGRQTQFRRPVKFQPGPEAEIVPFENRFACNGLVADIPEKMRRPFYCPLGVKGDRLWVQEIWTLGDSDGESFADIFYRAGGEKVRHEVPEPVAFKHREKLRWLEVYGNGGDNWQSSTCMPRWASRITLEIVGVRAERLQETTPKDAIAEGCMPSHDSGLGTPERFRRAAELVGGPYPRGIFADLWQSINGLGSWDANPWVWCIEFRRVNDE